MKSKPRWGRWDGRGLRCPRYTARSPGRNQIVPESLARRFEVEGRALASFNHPNICTVYDVGPNYLVMELVGGQTLRELLRRGPLALADALRHAAQIADALGAAHAHGIVHRDLKPGNVMVTDTGVKVLDFGIAKYTRTGDENAETDTAGMTEAAITARGQIVGTPAYMSPEQAEGKPVDARSDVFAFGIVLYEMVCGQVPFRGDTTLAALASTLQGTPEPPSHLRREVPRPLEHLILRCLEKSPDARFSSGQELRKAFAELERSTRVASVSVARASLIAVALVLVIGAGVFLWRSYQTTSRARWVEETAVPEIRRLLEADRTLEARRRFRQAEEYARESRSLFKLAEGVAVAHAVAFETDPQGAQIYISDYAAAPRGRDSPALTVPSRFTPQKDRRGALHDVATHLRPSRPKGPIQPSRASCRITSFQRSRSWSTQLCRSVCSTPSASMMVRTCGLPGCISHWTN